MDDGGLARKLKVNKIPACSSHYTRSLPRGRISPLGVANPFAGVLARPSLQTFLLRNTPGTYLRGDRVRDGALDGEPFHASPPRVQQKDQVVRNFFVKSNSRRRFMHKSPASTAILRATNPIAVTTIFSK